MEKKLKNLKNGSYEISLSFTTDEYKNAEDKAFSTLAKDVEIQGFRKGQAPKKLVEKKINTEYLQLLSFENLFNIGMKEVLDENKEIKFVGEPYAMDKKEGKDWVIILTFTLDIYPEVKVLNKEWENMTIDIIDGTATEKDVQDAMLNLQKNYAEYKDTEEITTDTVSRISMKFLDAQGEELEKWFVYVGEPEFTAEKKESDFWKEHFVGKKRWENFDITYKKSLVPVLQPKNKDLPVKQITFEVLDVKKVELPEMNEENIKKFFGDKAEVKNKAELETYIKGEIEKQKFDTELLKSIDGYLREVNKKSMDVQIPQTLVTQEYASRLKNLEQRFGGAENTKKYLESLGDEKRKVFEDDIRKASKESLEKFFVLQQVCEYFEIKLDPENKAMEVEKQLYEKLKK